MFATRPNMSGFILKTHTMQSVYLHEKGSIHRVFNSSLLYFFATLKKFQTGLSVYVYQGFHQVWYQGIVKATVFGVDSQQGRVRTTSILVRAFGNFKRKFLKYSRNCSLHNTLIPNLVKPLNCTYITGLDLICHSCKRTVVNEVC